MTTSGMPLPRKEHTAIWAGNQMIVWGGVFGGVTLDSGGRYVQADSDGDGAANVDDNCPTTRNPDQLDKDVDGLGNACDEDDDGDAVSDGDDADPLDRFVCRDADEDHCDTDADGFCAAGDCADGDAAVWHKPGEATGLLLSHAGGPAGTTTLVWSAPANPGGTSLVYDTVSSLTAADFEEPTAVCVETDDGSDTQATDTSTPGTGEVRYFLTRAGNACGDGLAGETSAGEAHSLRACP